MTFKFEMVYFYHHCNSNFCLKVDDISILSKVFIILFSGYDTVTYTGVSRFISIPPVSFLQGEVICLWWQVCDI